MTAMQEHLRHYRNLYFTGLIAGGLLFIAGCGTPDVISSQKAATLIAPTPTVEPVGLPVLGNLKATGPNSALLAYNYQQLRLDDTDYQCERSDLTVAFGAYPVDKNNSLAAGTTILDQDLSLSSIAILDSAGVKQLLNVLKKHDSFPQEWQSISEGKLVSMIQQLAEIHEPFHLCTSGFKSVDKAQFKTDATQFGFTVDTSNIKNISTQGFTLKINPKYGKPSYYNRLDELAVQMFTRDVIDSQHAELGVIKKYTNSAAPAHLVFLQWLDYDHNLVEHMKEYKEKGALFGPDSFEEELTQRIFYKEMEDIYRVNSNPAQDEIDAVQQKAEYTAKAFLYTIILTGGTSEENFNTYLQTTGYQLQ